MFLGGKMKICPSCNATVGDDARFCVKCGFNIKKHEEENNAIFCPSCGTKFSGGVFCPQCGYNVSKDLAAANNNTDSFDNIDFSDMQTEAEKQLLEKIQKATEEFIKKIDQMAAEKEKDIMTV